MDSVADYARQWTKREKEDLYTLSEWVKSVRSLNMNGELAQVTLRLLKLYLT
jgi:hypothetical protein